MWLSAIDEDVHSDKKPVGALVHSIQAVSDHHVFSHTFDIHVVQGKACYHVVGDGCCNGHYNRTPDLGKCVMRWDVWDLARYTILDAKVLDRNVTWLTKHKDTS